MKRFRNFLLKILLLVSLVSVPFASIIIYTESTPNVYQDSFLAEINDKYSLLKKTDSKKIVFIGGSSLPFGINSKLIEESFPDYKVVDFGLYATLGTKFMLDISRNEINKDDIVIISPELNPQTYSLYFNPKAVLKATDGFSKITHQLKIKDKLSLLYNYFDFAKEKYEEKPVEIAGIYRHDSFNEYGDIKVERKNNILPYGFDPNQTIKTDSSLLNEEFFEYVNKYIKKMNKKDAKCLFNFSPCNNMGTLSSSETRTAFSDKLRSKINCEFLLDINDCVMDYRYFYDTNYHLNTAGSLFYTRLLINALRNVLNTGKEPTFDVPYPPEIAESEVIEPIILDDIDFDKYNGEAVNNFTDCFNYELTGSTYKISGVKEAYKNIEKVILPATFEGKIVTAIGENAFLGCGKLKEIFISKNYKVFEQKCFNGCKSLEKIHLYEVDGNKIYPDSEEFLFGTPSDVKICIPTGSNYTTGYTWMNYINNLVYED